MQFSKTTAALAAIPALAAAAPLSGRDMSGFTLVGSFDYNNVVQLVNITASSTSLNLGGNTETFCPDEPDCSTFPNITAFAANPGASVPVYLYDQVAGGQSIYVAPSGAIKYNPAHASQPQDAQNTVFVYTAPTGDASGHLTGTDFSTIVACPSTANSNPLYDQYQLYAEIEGWAPENPDAGECYEVQLLATQYDGPSAAWQYE